MRGARWVVILCGPMLIASAMAQPPGDDGATVAEAAAPVQTEKLSTSSTIAALLADARAKDVLFRHAPQVVQFFATGENRAMAPDHTPLSEIARFPQAQEAGLTPENMEKIALELQAL